MSKSAPLSSTTLQSTSAVIYCRVSSAAQMQKGHGLASQETRCREFARMKGYEVVQVFTDEAVSGGLINRPGMQAMLSFLRANRKCGGFVVLLDDISRIARSIQVHLELRSAIAETGARLESPSIEFGEDSDSILVENLLASVSQHQREKNAEQTRNRMRSRLMNGYWPFIACMGYRHVSKPGEGRVLVRDEPLASIIQEAMEGYACGRFRSQAEVARFLERHNAFPKSAGGKVRYQLANTILTKPLYAGYVENPDWGVELRKGKHEGLISFETFERIQKRLKEGSYAPMRADISEDFPLRGAVSCACCGKPLTACWSKSKTGARHPYYMCFAKGCERKGKAIRRDVIEGAFVDLLDGMTPRQNLFDLAHAMFKRAWSLRLDQARAMKLFNDNEVAKIDKQIGVMLDRIVDALSESVIAAYEKRIAELERGKLLLAERRANIGRPKRTFEEMFEHACSFLASPLNIWKNPNPVARKLVLKLAFAERLQYRRDTGFRTPKTTLPFKVLGDFLSGERMMAEREGFEPSIRFPVYTRSRRAP